MTKEQTKEEMQAKIDELRKSNKYLSDRYYQKHSQLERLKKNTDYDENRSAIEKLEAENSSLRAQINTLQREQRKKDKASNAESKLARIQRIANGSQ